MIRRGSVARNYGKIGELCDKAQKPRTDSTHIQAAARKLHRLACVGETMRYALNRLAAIAPEWWQARAPSDWYERYGPRCEQ